jgi:hypothetical protein
MENWPRERGEVYISGHPLDDYKFEMKYFLIKLEALRSLELHVVELDLWRNYK